MNPTKALDINGLPGCFYKKIWKVGAKDVIEVCLNIFNNNDLFTSINSTIITLIPIIKSPQFVKDHHPISLCNFIYKIITNRIKKTLIDSISEHQGAFVGNINIHDNFVIGFEGIYVMKKNKWANGEVYGGFRPERGLREEDTLCPCLFLFCVESLSCYLQKMEGDGKITGLHFGIKETFISHLFYADDSLLFCNAEMNECLIIKDILKNYEKVLGQMVNFIKFEISFGSSVDSKKFWCQSS